MGFNMERIDENNYDDNILNLEINDDEVESNQVNDDEYEIN